MLTANNRTQVGRLLDATKNNAVFSLLSNDLSTLLYSTFMGGQGTNLRANAFGPDGSIWVAGHSPGPEWPLKNAYPNVIKAGLVLAKFMPASSTSGELLQGIKP